MNFFQRWRQGIRDATLQQQLQAKEIGLKGQLIGFFLALAVLLTNGFWYWSPVLIFTIVLVIVDIIGVKQQLRQLTKMRWKET